MNLDQAAQFLRVNRATLDRWIRQGLLADAGLRGAEFDGGALAAWARRHDIQVRAAQKDRSTTPADLLADAIERGAVVGAVRARDAGEAIARAVEAHALDAEAHAKVLDETLLRERLAATALGHGVAIPHPRQPRGDLFEEAHISVVFLAEPIDWAAIDGRPVHSVLHVLSPNTAVHLQLLARIAFVLRTEGAEEFLRSQPSQAALVERLRLISREN